MMMLMPGTTHLQNDLLCDLKPYSFTYSSAFGDTLNIWILYRIVTQVVQVRFLLKTHLNCAHANIDSCRMGHLFPGLMVQQVPKLGFSFSRLSLVCVCIFVAAD